MAVHVTCKAAAAALALASVLSAQALVPHAAGQCSGARSFQSAPKPSSHLPQRFFGIKGSGFCDEYTVAGWDGTMKLYLGEGAAEYFGPVSLAVSLWNDALVGFSRDPVIEIAFAPSASKIPRLSSNFWNSNYAGEVDRNVEDGQSAIYFKGGGNPDRVISFAAYRWQGGKMLESDVYINTTLEELYGPAIARVRLIDSVDESLATYALVNSTFLTVLHELGHLLGIGHIPVAGNIMSYNYMPAIASQWKIPLSLYLAGVLQNSWSDPSTLPFVYKKREKESFLMTVSNEETLDEMSIFTSYVTLGEQDRMALMCIYDFEDWNH